MKLTLKSKYKSLEPFTFDLPDFTILTGLNGSGKTQILTGIIENQILLTEEKSQLNPKKYITHTTLTPNESAIVTRQSILNGIEKIWKDYQNFIDNYRVNPNVHLLHQLADHRKVRVIHNIAKAAEKTIYELTSDDFYNHYPLEDGLSIKDIFYQNFSSLFKRYNDKLILNKFNKFLNEIEGQKEIKFLSSEDFIKTYGEPPWEFANKIIAEANLDYEINSPIGLNQDAPFELKLINKINKSEIKFSDLSSGEKVLMSLTLAMYNSQYDIDFPKTILMDEPDASLHPSMSKQLLEVIRKVFVEEKGVKIILTTHSLSTVALAEEESLFVVNKTGNRLEKCTKDRALKILTFGVPSFSVNYENRRQIFVESSNDAIFYEKIFQKLSANLISEISLSFISSGESRTDKNGVKISNCDQVINITSTLRKAGNNFVWGIIDWDKTNAASDFVKVLGNGNRYAIENYLFDPILLAALLFREKIITRENLKLNNNETYADFKKFNCTQLQFISDFIIQTLATKSEQNDIKMTKSVLMNGLEIDVPNWFFNFNGHKLEELILKTFPSLNSLKKGKEEALKLEIINKVIDDLPELISKDFLDIFKSLQTV